MLVERPGEVVTRDEVRHGLWPGNTFVEFDNNLGVAIRKVREALNDNAEAPRYVETLPRRGYRFIAPVIVQEMESPAAEMPPIAPPQEVQLPVIAPTPVSGSRWYAWAGGAVLLLLLLVAGYRWYPRPKGATAQNQSNSVAAAPRVRRSVAVLGFRNLAGRPQDEWLSPVFSEMLNTELGISSDLRMVSGEDVARAKRELPLGDQDSLGSATLQRLRTNPGADVVLLGSYLLVERDHRRQIRLDLRLQDTVAGDTIAEEAVTGDENDLLALAADAGSRLRANLGVKTRPDADASLRAALPANQAATRLYVEGRARLWAYDMLGARDLLVKAVAADPDFPLGHSALSEALWHLGYQVKARAEAKRAMELATGLPPQDRLLIEGQYRRSIADWPQTVQAYQSLFAMYPDSLDYGLLLASAQSQVKPAAALQTLAALRRLPPPIGNDALIDMAEASAWIGQDLAKARAAAQVAIQKGTAQGSHALVARTYGFLCQQGPGLGVALDEAISDCERSRESSKEAGDPNGEALMLTDLGAIYFQRGDIARCEEVFREAIQKFNKVGDLEGAATAMSNLAAARIAVGDATGARKLLEAATPDYEAIQDQDGVALNLNNLGDLLHETGNLQAAETTYQQARATAQEIDDKSALAYVLNGMGDVLTDRGDLTGARSVYEQSLSLRRQIGEKATAGETEVALARVSIEEGQPAKAETVLRQWIDQFAREHQSDDELMARTYLVESLLAQGRQQEAEKEVAAAHALEAGSQSLFAKMQFDLCAARGLLQSDDPQAAKALLSKLLADSRKYGYSGIELEALLIQAELEKKSGIQQRAELHRATVEHQARGKGYGLIARKAAAVRV
jgi:tetratricopeptide (TPR) repeat protein